MQIVPTADDSNMLLRAAVIYRTFVHGYSNPTYTSVLAWKQYFLEECCHAVRFDPR